MRWSRFAAVVAGTVALGLATVFVLQNEQVAALCVYAAGVAILVIVGWMLMKCGRSERAGLLAVLILTMQVILFFIFYQQMSTSLTLFALRNVDPSFKLFNMTSFSWSAAQFQALNPLWIMLLSPFLAIAYTQLARSGHDIPIAAKYALGFMVVALGFFVFAFSGRYAVDGRVSWWFMVSGDMGCTRSANCWSLDSASR